LEYPHAVTINKRKGFCVEIDGSQHDGETQKRLDKRRDDVLLESDWINTVRLKTSEFTEVGLKKHFDYLNEREFSRKLFEAYHTNYSVPLYQLPEGMRAMELVLTPHAVARIQYSLVKAVISGFLSFDEKVWKIAVLERDVPCARLATEDLKRFLGAFAQLENTGRVFPEIELSVYYTAEFEDSSLRNKNDLSLQVIGENKTSFDVFIDISMLERDGLSKRHEAVVYDTFLQIRSAYHFPIRTQPFLTSNRITWGNLVLPVENDQWEDHPLTSKGLEFFIQNIFRKKTFRDGQLRILDRALRNQTVIGLLPTGGGKSLTYQLAGILQPGHVIVIDPIKSLMKDQVDSLSRIGITGTVFINSSLKDFEARNRAQSKLSNGHALFCFISPERLMIEKFRFSLGSMADEKHFFSYGVVDEVHCVSEWGHNFRTPYLSLGRNLIDFCKAADGQIALFGLTATASFDVLSDVQRELSGNNENQMIPDEAIIRHENTNRDELQYYVEKVDLKQDRILELQDKAKGAYFGMRLNEQFGLLKQKRINEILLNPGPIIRKFNSNPQEVIN
jgi:ATP-dependent DNA helicase RecQ